MEFSTTKNSLRFASWHVALSLTLGSLNSDAYVICNRGHFLESLLLAFLLFKIQKIQHTLAAVVASLLVRHPAGGIPRLATAIVVARFLFTKGRLHFVLSVGLNGKFETLRRFAPCPSKYSGEYNTD